MESEWPSSPLSELCLKIGSGATPRGGSNVYVNHGARFIRSQNVYDLRFESAGLAHLDDGAAEQLRGVAVKSGDVLINITGDSVARACLSPEDGHEARVSQHVAILRPDPARVVARFLVYWLVSPRVKAHLLSLASAGATRKALTKEMLSALRLPVPSVGEQCRIASVLRALEDKIDSNRRLAALLEETAATVFRAQFVDFVGLDEFEDTETGRVPRGWCSVAVADIVQKTIGGVWGEDAPSAKTPVAVRCLRGIDVHVLSEGQIPDPPIRYVSTSQLEKRRLHHGDILVEGSGSFCGRSGFFAPAWQALYVEELTYSNFCKRLRPTVGIGQAALAWLALNAAYESGQTATFRTGSAFPNLDVDGLAQAVRLALPPENRTGDFMSLFELAYDSALRKESSVLCKVRDALLPKLISGQIRVHDTADPEEAIGPVAEQLAAETA